MAVILGFISMPLSLVFDLTGKAAVITGGMGDIGRDLVLGVGQYCRYNSNEKIRKNRRYSRCSNLSYISSF